MPVVVGALWARRAEQSTNAKYLLSTYILSQVGRGCGRVYPSPRSSPVPVNNTHQYHHFPPHLRRSCLPRRFDRGKLLVCPAHWSWPSLQPSYVLLDVAAPAGPASVAWGASLGAREGERKGLLAEMTRGGCIDAGVLAGELRDVLLQGAKRELQVRGGGGGEGASLAHAA